MKIVFIILGTIAVYLLISFLVSALFYVYGYKFYKYLGDSSNYTMKDSMTYGILWFVSIPFALGLFIKFAWEFYLRKLKEKEEIEE